MIQTPLFIEYYNRITGENLLQDQPPTVGRQHEAGKEVRDRTVGRSCSHNIPADETLYKLVLSSQKGICKQTAVGCTLGTKTLADETVKRTEAMANCKEGNLLKHSPIFSTPLQNLCFLIFGNCKICFLFICYQTFHPFWV